LGDKPFKSQAQRRKFAQLLVEGKISNETFEGMVRYALVGLGHIAQVAVIPAFAHARRNSMLVAVVSGNRTKRREIAKRYRLEHAFSYDEYDECLGLVDAVYIALPNSMHAEYAIRAARAGVHVLCEKPMAVTVEECRRMIAAADKGQVKLMVAYRLHFEAVNLKAIDLARVAISAISSSSTRRSP
jgi:predicted dehydrogenase